MLSILGLTLFRLGQIKPATASLRDLFGENSDFIQKSYEFNPASSIHNFPISGENSSYQVISGEPVELAFTVEGKADKVSEAEYQLQFAIDTTGACDISTDGWQDLDEDDNKVQQKFKSDKSASEVKIGYLIDTTEFQTGEYCFRLIRNDFDNTAQYERIPLDEYEHKARLLIEQPATVGLNSELQKLPEMELKTHQDKNNFASDETPQFDLEVFVPTDVAVPYLSGVLTGNRVVQLDRYKLVATVKDYDGEPTMITPELTFLPTGEIKSEIKHQEELVPGAYKLEVEVYENDQLVDSLVQDFSWGVLAMNFDRDVYLPGETAVVDIAVLDRYGEMVCDAEVELTVNDALTNSVYRSLTTSGGDISVSEFCDKKEFTLEPDYGTKYTFPRAGEYYFRLRADSSGGVYEIAQTLQVTESRDISLQRESATRLFPPLLYPMQVMVGGLPNEPVKFTEQIPANFAIFNQKILIRNDVAVGDEGGSGQRAQTIAELAADDYTTYRIDDKLIWELTPQAGVDYIFAYEYDAPDISPDFYLLGPARIFDESGEEIYTERRGWQLAIDATDGPRSPNSANITDDFTVGSKSWQTTSNAASQSDTYAQSAGAGAYTMYYLAATNFGFNINASSIDGIVAEVDRYYTSNGDDTCGDNSVRIIKGGSISGNEKAIGGNWATSDTDTYTSYGGSSDLWGLSWSQSDINATNFGIGISATCVKNGGPNANTVNVDHIRITVYYTPNAMSVSGNVYNAGTTTALTECDGDSGTHELSLRAGSTTYTTSCSSSDGSYTFSSVTPISTGEGMVAWIDDAQAPETDGALVIRYDGTGDSTNNIFYDDTVTITSDDTNPVDILDMNTYDNGNDADIPYTATDASPDTLVVNSGYALLVKLKSGVASGSDVFDPGGTVTTNSTGGDFHIDDNAKAYLDTVTNTVGRDILIDGGATLDITASTNVNGGDITTSGTSATLTLSSGIPTVTMSGTGSIGGGTTPSLTFGNLSTSGTGTTTISSPITVNNDVSVGGGTTLTVGANLSIDGGDFTTSTTGIINYSGTPTVDIDGTGTVGGGSGAITFYDLDLGDGTTDTTTLSSAITAANSLTVNSSQTFAMSTYNTTVGSTSISGSGDVIINGATSYSSAGTFTILSNTSDAQLSGSGEFNVYNLTIGDGSNTVSVDNETNDLSLIIERDFSITANATYSASSSVPLNIFGSYSNVGTFTANSGEVSMSNDQGDSNTLSGNMTGSSSFYDLRFDDAGNDSSWSFSNDVTVLNDFIIIDTDSTTGVTAPSGTLTVNGDFTNNDEFTNNSGTVVLGGATGSTQTLSGFTEFYNLTATGGGRTIFFDNTATFGINPSGTLTLTGTDCDDLLVLRSDSFGNQYNFDIDDPDGNFSISYVDVQDSSATQLALSASSSVDSGNNSNWTISASACEGTSSAEGTAYSFQRKTFYDNTNSRYWMFFHDGDQIDIKYSSDATNWNTISSLAIDTADFSVWSETISSTEYVFLAYTETNDIKLRVGTLSATSISWDGTIDTVLSGTGASDDYSYPYVSLDSSDYIWIGARYYNGSNYNFYTVKSDAVGSTALSTLGWGTATQISSGQSNASVYGNIVPLSGQDMYATFTEGTDLKGCQWDHSAGEWGSQDTIDTTLAGTAYSLSAVADVTDYDVHLLYYDDETTDQISYKRWDSGTTTWDSSAVSISSGTGGWLDNWANRIEITVSNTYIDSDLTHFPLLLTLGSSVGTGNDDVTAVFDEIGSNSKKIAITKSDGTTQIYAEIEKWDATGEDAWIWVSKDDLTLSSSSSTILYLYYDNSKSDNTTYIGDINSTAGANVWDSNYELVYHLTEEQSGTGTTGLYKDSTVNNNDGNDGISATNQDGFINGGHEFDQTDDNINSGSASSIDDIFYNGGGTIEAWVNPDDAGESNNGRIIDKGENSGAGWSLLIGDSGGSLEFRHTTSSNEYCWYTSSDTLSFNSWNYSAVTWDGNEANDAVLYIDSSSKSTSSRFFCTATGGINSDASQTMYVGMRDDSQREFDGHLDEIRVSSVDRPEAWIKASYYSGADNIVEWNSSESLPTSTYGYPSLSFESGTKDLYAFWIDTSNNYIKYRQCDVTTATSECSTGTNWQTAIDWQTSGTNTYLTTSYAESQKVFGEWTDGSAAPFNVQWDDISFGASNNNPDDPTSLVQAKTDDTVLAIGDWTNESSVKFSATVSDTDNPETLSLCIEIDPIGTPFSNTEDSCGTGVAYSGTGVTATHTISGLSDGTEYHWQARVKDDENAYSNWVIYSSTGGDWLSGWDNRYEIIVDSTNIDSDLTHFPLLLTLGTAVGTANDDVSPIFDEVGSNSKKIAITKSDGTTQIYGEIEKWDSSSEQAWIWVSKSDLTLTSASDTTLYLYYDNDQADNTTYIGDTNSTAAESVWDSSFGMVHHLSETTTGATDFKDSTSNNNDSVSVNLGGTGSDVDAVGISDGAVQFDGVDDKISFGDVDINSTDFTISAWINLDSFSADQATILSKYELLDYRFSFRVGTDGALEFYHQKEDKFKITAASTIGTANWYHVSAVFDDSIDDISMYSNGSLLSNSQQNDTFTDGFGDNISDMTIGRREDLNDEADGVVDELRLSYTIRSDAWIKAEYFSVDDNLISWNESSQMDVGVDTSAPTGGNVYDGTSTGVDTDDNDGSLTQLSANWSGFNASASGLDKYEYSIGTTSGGTDIKTWTDVGTSTNTTASGLTLQTGQLYFFNIRITDNAGNTAIVSSDGQSVLPTLSVTLDSNQIAFLNLNPGNSWTDTETTSLTVETNAYHGYVSTLYATGNLTNSANPAYSIANYSGSNSAPTSWSGNGFGYTTNDNNLIGGTADRFTNGGPNYAGFTNTGPGLPVADHTANITGSTGPANDNFTITYRVTTPSDQAAGAYSTTLIYVVTPSF